MGQGSSNIIHFGITRIRVVGAGNLDLEFQGYNNILTQTLVPIAMSLTDSREKTRLSNFISQYGKLKGSTDEIDEVMRINSIIVFVKEMYTDYPA